MEKVMNIKQVTINLISKIYKGAYSNIVLNYKFKYQKFNNH